MEHKTKWRKAFGQAAKYRYYILAAAAAFSLAAMSTAIYAMENPGLTNADFIRLHVVAHSDTYEDQALKLKVRDGVLNLLTDKLTELGQASDFAAGDIAEKDVKQAARYIKQSFPDITKTAEQIIRENGYDYPVTVSLTPRWIPEKTYGSAKFPAGEYQALHIAIGAAEGENWWCVLFPPLCLIDTSPEANEATEGAVQIEVKFKTVEILEKVLE